MLNKEDRDLAPNLCYLGMVILYLIACFFFDSAVSVAVGFALGWIGAAILQWKQDRRDADHLKRAFGEPQ